MIFVTVGTHEQPFNRLVKKVDALVANGSIQEEVVMQTGFSTFKPEHCKWQKMMSFDEMQQNLKNARIVITFFTIIFCSDKFAIFCYSFI